MAHSLRTGSWENCWGFFLPGHSWGYVGHTSFFLRLRGVAGGREMQERH